MMYSITHIYVKRKYRIRALTPNEITLRSLLDEILTGTDVVFAISVYDDVMKKDYVLDAMTILQEKCANGTDTWQSLVDQLTEEHIVGYQGYSLGFRAGSDLPNSTARLCYPITTKGMQCHYCNINSPNEWDIFQFRWGMPDMMIDVQDSALDFKLDNAFAIVNGMASYSHMYEDRMYIHDGARHLWCTTDRLRPDVLLIDTTPIGNMQMYRLNTCEKRYRNVANENWVNSEWEIVLPDGVSLHTHSVILVLGGAMYLPGEYGITSYKSIVFHPETLLLDKQLLHKYKSSAALFDTVYCTDTSVESYLHQIFISDKINDAFIIAIDNPNMYIHSTEVCPYADHHLGLVDSIGGFLRQRSDHLVHSYMKSDYNTLELVYPNVHNDSYVFDVPYLGTTPGMEAIRLDKHHFKNIRETVCDLIHLTT